MSIRINAKEGEIMDSNVVSVLKDENRLLEEAAAGSRTAYTILYTFYLPKLYKYILPFTRFSKEDTEEILHDIFMKIWERKEGLSGIRSFNSYIYSMARNKLVNLHEHSKVKQKAFDYIVNHSELSGNSADQNYIYSQYREVMQRAIDALPPKRRQVFEMSTYEELSQDQIATELKISKSMVKKQLYAATRHVKEYLRLHTDLTVFMGLCFASGLIK
ncbi:RNA polymerase sigma-70 factor (family 1) [Pedobacter africanus]|uniref:RNA polymerase sigma-70 factor (ECF subfamily) n=1 Tax=Pedobacter africanus TaxID=151894 RepID=A0ACC6KV13_9SPHI|nr:sigma-70 family RNA polymerase sigma factor [Pedobacter africanus]MDR6783035.1 RNA polymerase sigma-70 factor (ECF subfamily) [Pedobacter africanus]